MTFWRQKSLLEMTNDEWESLCDGCGLCCLNKIEDDTLGEVRLTNVACRLLDGETCRCRDYPNRLSKVSDCLQLTPSRISSFNWLPKTCAYRRLSEGDDLPDWHPLITGDPESVHDAGISVRGKTVSEDDVAVADYEDYVVNTLKVP